MATSLFVEAEDFINHLKTTTGNSLPEWFDCMAGSGQAGFLNIRRWLVDEHRLNTPTATTIARLYLEDLERNAPKVTFFTEGRGGDFSYESKEGRFTSFWEFGGGNALALLFVPSEQNWEAQTGIPLSKRATVLEFIGEKTLEQQARGCTYAVEGDCIVIYRSKN